MQKIKLKPGTKPTLEEQFPNEGQIEELRKAEMPDNNFFKNYSKDEIRKKYLMMNVLMEILHDTIELEHHATIDQFARRVSDLAIAANSA